MCPCCQDLLVEAELHRTSQNSRRSAMFNGPFCRLLPGACSTSWATGVPCNGLASTQEDRRVVVRKGCENVARSISSGLGILGRCASSAAWSQLGLTTPRCGSSQTWSGLASLGSLWAHSFLRLLDKVVQCCPGSGSPSAFLYENALDERVRGCDEYNHRMVLAGRSGSPFRSTVSCENK